MEIVVNKCYGGFGLSIKAIVRYLELKGENVYFYKQTEYEHDVGYNEFKKVNPTKNTEYNGVLYKFTKDHGEIINSISGKDGWFYDRDIERTDPDLVQTVKELGDEANSWASELVIKDIPDDLDYFIDDYDGIETVRENHRTW